MDILQNYKERFKNLAPGQKRLFIALGIVLLCVLYFNLFLKPNIIKFSSLKKQQSEAAGQLKALSAGIPDIEKIKKGLISLREDIAGLKNNSRETESKLLNNLDAARLLSELMKCAQGLKIDFISVKQKIEEDKGGYSRFFAELKFAAPYEQALRYIARAEGISPFAKVEEIDLGRPKAAGKEQVAVTLTIGALLSSASGTQGQVNPCGTGEPVIKLSSARDPFAPSIKLEQVSKKITLKLAGITYRGLKGASTAIINDTVLKVGDKVEGCTVEKITNDSVTVDNGTSIDTLTVER